MSAPNYTTYDFRLAEAADDSANAFRTWMAKASQVFSEQWNRLANADGSIKTTNIRTQLMDVTMESAPASNICCTFNISEHIQSIWHVSQDDAQEIVTELLGMSPMAEAAKRPLTNLELVLVNTFFEAIAISVRVGWLGTDSLTGSVESTMVNPKRVRLCRGKDLVITGSLQIQLDRADVTLHWVSKKEDLSGLLEQVSDRRLAVGEGNDPREVVDLLPIEIIGVLGEAQVSMRRLANMAVGDIVKLNQRIDQPIVASVAGKPFFECWPGKIGKTVGLEVASCIGSPELAIHSQEEAVP